jgi:formylglycine-generating enzyme required for sulfatase activity
MIGRSLVVSAIAPLVGCGLVIGLSPVSFDATADDSGTDASVDVPSTPPQDGPPPAGPGCSGLAPTCGGNDSCCASARVAGGTFKRSYDGVTFTDATYEAIVSSFVLDTYEVTVARFRGFVADYPANLPKQGSGWDPTWTAKMPPNAVTLKAAFVLCSGATWSSADPENLPMNCVTWYEAFAFCVWDGGRLPTEAEWNYAASGGADQRVYPWSAPPSDATIDATHAVYSLAGKSGPAVVGSRPSGRGKYGHLDLAGNVEEWVLDVFDNYRTPCSDCANLGIGSDVPRVLRGGAFASNGPELLNGERVRDFTESRLATVGIRCARDAR